MKYIFLPILIFLIFSDNLAAWSPHNLQSANFIAEKGIINDQSMSQSEYNLDNNITRREMLKILMNLSGKQVTNSCLGAFQDIPNDDWGCKYAEAAVKQGYIAQNSHFRPDDLVTQIEALKMIMQAVGLERDSNDDWRAGYVSKATREKIIDDTYFDYNVSAVRGWIFSNVARSYDDFDYTKNNITIDDPAIDELFNTLFDL